MQCCGGKTALKIAICVLDSVAQLVGYHSHTKRLPVWTCPASDLNPQWLSCRKHRLMYLSSCFSLSLSLYLQKNKYEHKRDICSIFNNEGKLTIKKMHMWLISTIGLFWWIKIFIQTTSNESFSCVTRLDYSCPGLEDKIHSTARKGERER